MTSKVLGIDLHDAGRDGIYRVVPDDPPTLAADAERAGLRLVEVDVDDAQDDATVRARLARAFAVPGDGSGDWDALAEGLRDLRWVPEPGSVLLVRHAYALAHHAPQTYRQMWERLDAVARAWYQRGAPFFVFLEWPDTETRDAAIDA